MNSARTDEIEALLEEGETNDALSLIVEELRDLRVEFGRPVHNLSEGSATYEEE